MDRRGRRRAAVLLLLVAGTALAALLTRLVAALGRAASELPGIDAFWIVAGMALLVAAGCFALFLSCAAEAFAWMTGLAGALLCALFLVQWYTVREVAYQERGVVVTARVARWEPNKDGDGDVVSWTVHFVLPKGLPDRPAVADNEPSMKRSYVITVDPEGQLPTRFGRPGPPDPHYVRDARIAPWAAFGMLTLLASCAAVAATDRRPPRPSPARPPAPAPEPQDRRPGDPGH
jgi:hypothetical protein